VNFDFQTGFDNWHAQAFYDGDSGHLPSKSASFAFTVGD
jgi:hypothetical protein